MHVNAQPECADRQQLLRQTLLHLHDGSVSVPEGRKLNSVNIMKLQLRLLMKVDLSPNDVHYRTQSSAHPQLQPASTVPSWLSDLHITNAKNIAGFLHLCRSLMSDHSLLQGLTKEPLSSGATTGSSPLALQERY